MSRREPWEDPIIFENVILISGIVFLVICEDITKINQKKILDSNPDCV